MGAPSKIIALVLLTAFLVGCRKTTIITPREAFFQQHPDLRSRYDEFYETSPEAIAEAYDESLTFGIVLADTIQKDYSKYPDLIQDLDLRTKHMVNIREKGLPIVQEIKNLFDPKTDALFWYDYGHGQNQGQGYVIVRNGEFYRTFWTSGSIKRPDEIP